MFEKYKPNTLLIRSFRGDTNDNQLLYYLDFLVAISRKRKCVPITYYKYKYDLKVLNSNNRGVNFATEKISNPRKQDFQNDKFFVR